MFLTRAPRSTRRAVSVYRGGGGVRRREFVFWAIVIVVVVLALTVGSWIFGLFGTF
jgi:hypothetical protein